MKKIAFLLALLLVISLSVPVRAVEARSPNVTRTLNFNGTSANCYVHIQTGDMDSTIIATIQLWQGGTCIATWYANGLGTLNSSNTCAVTSGMQYTLTVSATVDGATISIPSVTKTCP